jgi:Rod binding domain-containing protein
MKNKLKDLNDHLFAQLERLGDEDMTDEQLAREVSRAHAIVGVADKIVSTAGIQLKAVQLAADHGNFVQVPFMELEFKNK